MDLPNILFLCMNKTFLYTNTIILSMGIDFIGRESFRILGLLTNGKLYLREISEKTGLPASTVHKTLAALEKNLVVKSSKNKNRKFFEPNYGSAFARSLLTALVVHNIMGAKEFRQLSKLGVRGIYLFGSCAEGRMGSDSDIDLAAYFEKKPDAELIGRIKRSLGSRLGREIQLIALSDEKLKSMEEGNVELLNRIKFKSIALAGEPLG